jgi:hypothetical protein
MDDGVMEENVYEGRMREPVYYISHLCPFGRLCIFPSCVWLVSAV